MTPATVCSLLMIAAIAILLLLFDRYYRISLFMEGFQSGGAAIRCGVDLPPCPHPFACMNGICRSTAMPYFPPTSSIQVLP